MGLQRRTEQETACCSEMGREMREQEMEWHSELAGSGHNGRPAAAGGGNKRQRQRFDDERGQ